MHDIYIYIRLCIYRYPLYIYIYIHLYIPISDIYIYTHRAKREENFFWLLATTRLGLALILPLYTTPPLGYDFPHFFYHYLLLPPSGTSYQLYTTGYYFFAARNNFCDTVVRHARGQVLRSAPPNRYSKVMVRTPSFAVWGIINDKNVVRVVCALRSKCHQ